MKHHVEARYDERFITEKLENGLKVILWHKPLMQTTACVFATPYGALDFALKDDEGNQIIHPSGIAHFLEHKMFEKQGKDVMTEFSGMGANVNAFTSYNETMYYFSISSEEIEEPLNLLLDFVQELNITDESVEKEKGIITQELMMYMQMPDARLYYEIFKALFHHHPYKYDIGGSPESVNATTRKQLEECYRMNYHPSRMLLVCAGPKDPEEMLEIIRKNQAEKRFDEPVKLIRDLKDEPETVAKEELFIPMDVTTSKVAVAIKLKPWYKDNRERVHDEWAIRCALEAHFSSLNSDYQKWIDDGIINDYFDHEIDLEKDAAFMVFVNETEDPRGFKDFILEQLKQCLNEPISHKLLSQLKKRYYGQAMRILNNVEDIAVAMARNLFNGVSLFDTLAMLENLDQKQVEEALSHIQLDHHALIALTPKNDK